MQYEIFLYTSTLQVLYDPTVVFDVFAYDALGTNVLPPVHIKPVGIVHGAQVLMPRDSIKVFVDDPSGKYAPVAAGPLNGDVTGELRFTVHALSVVVQPGLSPGQSQRTSQRLFSPQPLHGQIRSGFPVATNATEERVKALGNLYSTSVIAQTLPFRDDDLDTRIKRWNHVLMQNDIEAPTIGGMR